MKVQEDNIMIDIHSHILPCIDDGAKNRETAVRMLLEAYGQGIHAIIATPHYDRTLRYSLSELKETVEWLQVEASKIGENFTIYSGNELYYEEGCLEALHEDKALTLAGSRYVLVEFSVSESYKRIYYGMKDWILDGYCPVIAHMERYRCLYKDRSRIRSLVDLGCYMQANAESFLGGFFSSEAVYLRKLVEEECIHIIASDCHDLKERKCRMMECRRQLERKIDSNLVGRMFYHNPSKIIENKYI